MSNELKTKLPSGFKIYPFCQDHTWYLTTVATITKEDTKKLGKITIPAGRFKPVKDDIE